MPPEVRVIGVKGMPEMGPGDDLAGLMMDAAAAQGTPIEEGDILVVTQKVVSKVEGKVMSFEDVEPSQLAITITEGHRRDPRHTEMILREAVRIVRMDRGVIIAETKHGFYCANAGIDASNIPGSNTIALLPDDSDVSSQGIRAAVKDRLGRERGGHRVGHLRPAVAQRGGERGDWRGRTGPVAGLRGG